MKLELAPAPVVAKRSSGISAVIYSSLIGVSADEWEALCPGHPDPAELLQLVNNAGMTGFDFSSIVVFCDGKPRIVLPLMVARYPIVTTLEDDIKDLAIKVERRFPNLLNPKVVFVGFVEGEWGQIGVDRSAPPQVLQQCWKLAEKTLKSFSRKQKAHGIVFWQFSQDTLSAIPPSIFFGGSCVAGQPFGEMAVCYSHLDDYLNKAVDSDMRRYLKRAARNGSKIRIERTATPGRHTDRIFHLYSTQCTDSAMSFGQQSREYFARVCAEVPGAEYTLYFREEKLLAFELLIRHEQRLVSKYFGMEPEAGREHKLYFLSWLENVRYCIDHGIPILYAGASGEELKSKLGVRFVSTGVVIRASNPLVNLIIRKMQHELAYESSVELTPVSLPVI